MITEFFDFEENNKLFYRKVKDFYYWEFFRRQILYDLTLTTSKVTLKKWKGKFSFSSRKIYFNYIKRYFINKNQKNIDILLVADPRRILNSSNKYENIFIDNINIFLSKHYSTLILEEPSYMAWMYAQPPHLVPTMSNNVIYTDLIDIKCPFYRILLKYLDRNVYKQFISEIDYIIELVYEHFKINLDHRKAIYLHSLTIYYLMKNSYKKLIKKINPKIVLLNYKPTEIKALINAICKEQNITTVNLQHGIISKELNVEMQTRAKNLNVFPDYLFSYGEILTDCFDNVYNKENIKYIGHPYLENKSKVNIPLPNFMDKKFKYILIISQDIIGDEFSNIAYQLSQKLDNQKEFKIIYKYHPAEYHKDYKNLKRDNIIEVKSLEYDLYSLQKYSFVQIGSYSTGLYEGLIFRLPTIIMKNLYGANQTIKTLKFMKKGIYTVNDIEDLGNLIINNLIEKPLEEDIDRVWKSNSQNNLLKEIQKIINK